MVSGKGRREGGAFFSLLILLTVVWWLWLGGVEWGKQKTENRRNI